MTILSSKKLQKVCQQDFKILYFIHQDLICETFSARDFFLLKENFTFAIARCLLIGGHLILGGFVVSLPYIKHTEVNVVVTWHYMNQTELKNCTELI